MQFQRLGVMDALRVVWFADKLAFLLQQIQFAGTGDRFGAALHLKFAKDTLIVPLDRTYSDDQPLADLLIREALRYKLEDFQLAGAQRLDQRLDGKLG